MLMFLRSPSAIFWSFAFPVGILLLTGFIFNDQNKPSPELWIQDLDKSDLSTELIVSIQKYNQGRLNMIDQNADLNKLIREKSIPRVLTIPRGFRADVLNSKIGSLYLNYRSDNSAVSNMILGSIYAAIGEMNFDIVRAHPKLILKTGEFISERNNSISFYLPGIFGISVMYSGMFGLSMAVGSHRNSRLFRKFLTTPFKKWEWIISHSLNIIILIFLDGALMLLITRFVFQTTISLPFLVFPQIVFGIIIFSSLGVIIAGLTDRPETTAAAINSLAFPMMFLSGSFWPLELYPKLLLFTSKLIPLTYLNSGLRDLMVYENYSGGFVNFMVVFPISLILFILSSLSLDWREE